MRKFLLITIVFALSFIFAISFTKDIKAQSFEQTYKFDKLRTIEGGHTLAYYIQYRPEDVDQSLEAVKKRKAFGVRKNYLNDGALIRYRKQIISRFINESSSSMQYKVENKEEKTNKFVFGINANKQTSVTASLKQPSIKKTNATKMGIDFKKEITAKSTSSQSSDVKLSPNSILTHSLEGKGVIISGTAANYFTWVRTWYGTFEYLRVDDIFHQIEVLEVKAWPLKKQLLLSYR